MLDVLINMPMNEIVKELPLEDEVVEALTSSGGDHPLEQVLHAITAGEAGDFARASELLAGQGINPEIHARSQVAAFHWAAKINIENDA